MGKNVRSAAKPGGNSEILKVAETHHYRHILPREPRQAASNLPRTIRISNKSGINIATYFVHRSLKLVQRLASSLHSNRTICQPIWTMGAGQAAVVFQANCCKNYRVLTNFVASETEWRTKTSNNPEEDITSNWSNFISPYLVATIGTISITTVNTSVNQKAGLE